MRSRITFLDACQLSPMPKALTLIIINLKAINLKGPENSVPTRVRKPCFVPIQYKKCTDPVQKCTESVQKLIFAVQISVNNEGEF